LADKICQKANDVYTRETTIRITTRNLDSTEREKIENELQKDFETLIRNIYAFYPLLIKYVDLHRAFWLKKPDSDSEQLYKSVAEVFSIWIKSKMFKREEINFISANDIDNMLLIMPTGNSSSGSNVGNSNTAGSNTQSGSNENVSSQAQSLALSVFKNDTKKKKGTKSATTKKFTSLIVACLKRIFQIGMNFFGGNEQELIQLAKQKFIDMKTSVDVKNLTLAKNNNTAPTAPTPAADENSDLDLTQDQETLVEEFIRNYLKSPNYSESVTVNLNDSNAQKNLDVTAIDKVSYKKNKWQRMLYRKIGSKRHFTNNMQTLSEEDVVQRILRISKVLFGLHIVEHPLTKKKGVWRKLISSQRKRAVMACFRMAPLYSIPLHRAINLFLKSYKQLWLETDEQSLKDIIHLIPDLCPETENETQETDLLAIKSTGESSEQVDAAPKPAEEAASAGAEIAEVPEEPLKPDPLRQLISAFNRMATTEQSSSNAKGIGSEALLDNVYILFSDIMSKSCEIVEDDDDEEPSAAAEDEEEDQSKLFQVDSSKIIKN
jgi:ryanodine receptor 2